MAYDIILAMYVIVLVIYVILPGLIPLKRMLANAPWNYELRIDLEDWDGETRYAHYSLFDIGGPENNYALVVGGYMGTAGDAYVHHAI